MALLRKVGGWIVAAALFVYIINNIDQVIDILTKAVMFVVGIFEKIGDVIATGIDKADSATAFHAVVQLVSAVLGG